VKPVPEMVFRVSISPDLVKLRWLKGVDDVLWDSFCGMMRRKLTGNVATTKAKGQDEAKAKGEKKTDTGEAEEHKVEPKVKAQDMEIGGEH